MRETGGRSRWAQEHGRGRRWLVLPVHGGACPPPSGQHPPMPGSLQDPWNLRGWIPFGEALGPLWNRPPSWLPPLFPVARVTLTPPRGLFSVGIRGLRSRGPSAPALGVEPTAGAALR